ncbi:hypothetical protein BCV72DRAFT_217390 [Rhizopus microsporus var. microsporus]|uniref:Uncharacterized protein n=1 Tax=Rhizopus microsporus var. microsporus TaxID=86635 RepID=A0A1X0QNS0_RHIZD|nr:hypothetical protein BCV72DRAFT_217390 [Rhizopus microsporus var. microsporus]
MITGLVQDTQKKHILQQFPLPEFEEAGGLWICPFCQPVDKLPEAYSIITPPISQEQQLHAVKSTIKLHLEEHRKKLCKRMANESRLATYEKVYLYFI